MELIGSDIRSRKNADYIRNSIAGCAGEVELDFDGVEFISRTFADEVKCLPIVYPKRKIAYKKDL